MAGFVHVHICTWAILVIFFSNKPHSNTTTGKKGGEGEGEVEIIHMCIYMLLPV